MRLRTSAGSVSKKSGIDGGEEGDGRKCAAEGGGTGAAEGRGNGAAGDGFNAAEGD